MKISEKLEKWLLDNIWWIWLLFWLIVIEIYLLNFLINKETITLQSTITTIWTIFAFWYWYKKYERDKEIEMIDKLNLKENINELIIDWKIKKRLNDKWYINDYLFNIIQDEYLLRIFNLIWIDSNNWINKSNLYLFIEKAFNDKDLILYFLDILLKIKIKFEESIELWKIIDDLLWNPQNNKNESELDVLLNYIKNSEQKIKEICIDLWIDFNNP